MNRNGNGMVIGILVAVLILGMLGYLGTLLLHPAPTKTITPTPAVNRGDIDRSGSADDGDRMMIRKQMGCVQGQPCWNSVVGKTKDGDNPLYVFDLDLNKDGSITQADIDLVK
ncbi:MAG: dockerin type I domain-containing protein [bacterium]